MTNPPKWQIRRAFERAAQTYDQAASIQQIVCHGLLSGLPTQLPLARVLDAGCGTGFAHPLLRQRFPQAALYSLDLAQAMLNTHPADDLKIQGDLESLPLSDRSQGLYWSSLAMQWCDLPQVLAEARRVLVPGGHLALATLAEGTFVELRTAFAGLDNYAHTLQFATLDCFQAALRTAGFQHISLERRQEQAVYSDLKQLLMAVKAVGANQVGTGRRKGLFSRQALNTLADRYEAYRTAAGLPLSYDVLYCHAR